jgi:hypothetical protein
MNSGPQKSLRSRHDIFFQDHSRIDLEALRPFRGSHMIRDPRDVVVSAYFYHLRTTEEWALQPAAEYDGKSYQEYLKTFDKDEGLAIEIKRSAATVVRDMIEWRYDDPRFLELRYEEMMADEEAGFRRLFTHYGFNDAAKEAAVEIALGFSLSRVKKSTSHIRSGQPGEWRNHFTPEMSTLFNEATNNAAHVLGYETGPAPDQTTAN